MGKTSGIILVTESILSNAASNFNLCVSLEIPCVHTYVRNPERESERENAGNEIQ